MDEWEKTGWILIKVKELRIKETLMLCSSSKALQTVQFMLAALSQEKCRLKGVLFSDDSMRF